MRQVNPHLLKQDLLTQDNLPIGGVSLSSEVRDSRYRATVVQIGHGFLTVQWTAEPEETHLKKLHERLENHADAKFSQRDFKLVGSEVTQTSPARYGTPISFSVPIDRAPLRSAIVAVLQDPQLRAAATTSPVEIPAIGVSFPPPIPRTAISAIQEVLTALPCFSAFTEKVMVRRDYNGSSAIALPQIASWILVEAAKQGADHAINALEGYLCNEFETTEVLGVSGCIVDAAIEITNNVRLLPFADVRERWIAVSNAVDDERMAARVMIVAPIRGCV